MGQTSGTQTTALSFEKSPSSTARKTANGIAYARIERAASARSAPMPPTTSARPTHPQTASVRIAAVMNVPPAIHAKSRLFE